ncbi:MAG: hypothetical protein ACFKPT_01650 [Gloeotrichia echinulata GP01]|nr:hypothetical protein [Gloeotrichia echinulata DEX184]
MTNHTITLVLMTTCCILINTIASFSVQDNRFYGSYPRKVDKFVTEKTSPLLRINAGI